MALQTYYNFSRIGPWNSELYPQIATRYSLWKVTSLSIIIEPPVMVKCKSILNVELHNLLRQQKKVPLKLRRMLRVPPPKLLLDSLFLKEPVIEV